MIGKQSRYASSIIYIDGEQECIGARQPIDVSPRPDDRFHKVVEGDRVDILAYRYFGNPVLWWIICDYNEIAFPLNLSVGAILSIPSIEYVSMDILD